MSQRKGRKEEQEEIQVVEVTGSNVQAGNFFEQNQKMITYVVGALAIIAGLYFAYKYLYIGPKEKEAVNAMYKAEEMFAKDSFELALTNPGGGFDGFLNIIDNYSGTKSANLAKYYAGISYLNIGKFDEAIDYLNQYSANDNVTAITKAGALGDAHAEKGEKDKAESLYKEAGTKNENELLSPYYLNKLALLYYSNGKSQEAVTQLEEIRNKYPESPEGREAEKLIIRFQ